MLRVAVASPWGRTVALVLPRSSTEGRFFARIPKIHSGAFSRYSTSGNSGGNTWNWSALTGGTVADNVVEVPHTRPTTTQESLVLKNCANLYLSLMPLNKKLHGPLEQQLAPAEGTDEATLIGNNTLMPFVLLLGNHSSGKSSFINYVMGRDVQTAGVAPTDDSFTIITAGPEDSDQDGPALIFGNPSLGFSGLSQFGPTLIHHTTLKVRKDIQTPNFMMVDSPGMIDSPASMGGMLSSGNKTMDRGYDFTGVVRWFAERADIVLLFFDPDKPGTTGETLSILLHALGGMDHKLLIVLNKADQFEKIHDFARAYGSLCWNLSKVIPRKDLPRIFTMCLPVDDSKAKSRQVNTSAETSDSATPAPAAVKGGLADLHATRDDVVAEVMKAPKRRVDNVITHLYDSVCVLRMHTRICHDLRQRYNRHYWECRYNELGFMAVSLGLTATTWTVGKSEAMATMAAGAMSVEALLGTIVGGSILGLGSLTWYNGTKLRAQESELMTKDGLSASFQHCYGREIREGDEFIASVWQRIRDPLQSSLLQMGGISHMPSAASLNYDREVERLGEILESDIPSLRRQVSPTTSATWKS